MEKKNSVILYYDILEQLEDFTDDKFGKLMRCLIEYDKTNIVPKLPKDLSVAFKCIKPMLDANKQKYIEKCLKNKENIKKRWSKKDTVVYDGIQSYNSYTNDTDNDNDKDNENDKDIKKTWFNIFFDNYPKKDNKVIAFNIFCKKIKTEEYAKENFQLLKQYIIDLNDDYTYCKTLDNWLLANVEDEV